MISDILSACMKHLEHVFIVAHQIEQRCKIDAVGHRIDRRGFLGIGDLDQAQFRPIGVLGA